MNFVLIAGEASGDLLGAALIHALHKRFPDACFTGVTGPRMRESGCESLATIDALSVMGLAEVLPKLPSILRLRRRLFEQLRDDPPDCFIGIDAPDFNLGLEARLKTHGIRTVHVVSPSVWAWRPGRVKGIVAAIDLLLCLLPFEPAFYDAHVRANGAAGGFRAEFIGHPLAEELASPVSREDARRALGLPDAGLAIAVLPGSRGAELKYLAEPFAQTAAWLSARRPGLHFLVPLAKPALRAPMQAAIDAHAPDARWTLVDGCSREVMRAADAVLLASGTATLECLLLCRPMVVSYRASPVSVWLLRHLRLLKITRVSLPNLLSGQDLVPEILQEDARAETLGAALLALLDDPAACARQLAGFEAVAATLARDAGARAAQAIAELLAR